MSEVEIAHELVHSYVKEIGLTKEQTFNTENNAWYWYKGSAKIEVFIQTVKVGETHERHYLRVFSPIVKVPKTAIIAFYRKLLELNDTSLGVKLSIMAGSDQVYATFERDIKGMDYTELADIIADVEWWADHFDDMLIQEFGCEK
jgi:hypothetical protein